MNQNKWYKKLCNYGHSFDTLSTYLRNVSHDILIFFRFIVENIGFCTFENTLSWLKMKSTPKTLITFQLLNYWVLSRRNTYLWDAWIMNANGFDWTTVSPALNLGFSMTVSLMLFSLLSSEVTSVISSASSFSFSSVSCSPFSFPPLAGGDMCLSFTSPTLLLLMCISSAVSSSWVWKTCIRSWSSMSNWLWATSLRCWCPLPGCVVLSHRGCVGTSAASRGRPRLRSMQYYSTRCNKGDHYTHEYSDEHIHIDLENDT